MLTRLSCWRVASLLLLSTALSAPVLVGAQNAPAPDVAEPGSREAIAAATTEPRFLSPWVAVPCRQSRTVPSPRKFFGRIMGAPGELVDSEPGLCLRARARRGVAARARVHDRAVGGRAADIVLLAIADSQRASRISTRLKAANAALADPRTIDPAQAASLDRRLTAVLLLECGAAFGRNRLDRVGARTGLPARRLEHADDPADPHEHGRADQSGFAIPTVATSRSTGSTGI